MHAIVGCSVVVISKHSGQLESGSRALEKGAARLLVPVLTAKVGLNVAVRSPTLLGEHLQGLRKAGVRLCLICLNEKQI